MASPSALSDTDLLRAALGGDTAKFGALIERHFGLVFAVAHAHLRHPEMAEDLAQEVMLRAFLHLARLKPTDNFAAWVSRIARNLAIDWLRRGQRTSRLIAQVPLEAEALQVPVSETQGAPDMIQAQEEQEAVRRAIFDLPASQRELVLLHWSEDLNQTQIAERLGVTQATVSRQLKRALARLRSVLEPSLREVTPRFRVPSRAVARSVAIVGAAGAMSAAARADLAAADAVDLPAPSDGASTAQILGAASRLPRVGKHLASSKGLGQLVAGLVIVALGFFVLTRGTGPSSPQMPRSGTIREVHRVTGQGRTVDEAGAVHPFDVDVRHVILWTTEPQAEGVIQDSQSQVALLRVGELAVPQVIGLPVGHVLRGSDTVDDYLDVFDHLGPDNPLCTLSLWLSTVAVVGPRLGHRDVWPWAADPGRPALHRTTSDPRVSLTRYVHEASTDQVGGRRQGTAHVEATYAGGPDKAWHFGEIAPQIHATGDDMLWMDGPLSGTSRGHEDIAGELVLTDRAASREWRARLEMALDYTVEFQEALDD
jgi:RNA polymerase sigma-70 factor (ECF subfamily)